MCHERLLGPASGQVGFEIGLFLRHAGHETHPRFGIRFDTLCRWLRATPRPITCASTISTSLSADATKAAPITSQIRERLGRHQYRSHRRQRDETVQQVDPGGGPDRRDDVGRPGQRRDQAEPIGCAQRLPGTM
jgi:hypothetical protein